MLGCEKRSCDQQRSSPPSPAALHLAEAAPALPSLSCCSSARFVASHHPRSHARAFSSPKRSLIFIFFNHSRLPQALPDPDKTALPPDGVSPAVLSSPSPTQASRCSLALSLHALGCTTSPAVHLSTWNDFSVSLHHWIHLLSNVIRKPFFVCLSVLEGEINSAELIKMCKAFCATVCIEDHTK